MAAGKRSVCEPGTWLPVVGDSDTINEAPPHRQLGNQRNGKCLSDLIAYEEPERRAGTKPAANFSAATCLARMGARRSCS